MYTARDVTAADTAQQALAQLLCPSDRLGEASKHLLAIATDTAVVLAVRIRTSPHTTMDQQQACTYGMYGSKLTHDHYLREKSPPQIGSYFYLAAIS